MDNKAAIRDAATCYLAAYESHDSIGCGAVYAEDAIGLSPWGPPFIEPDAIAAAHVEWVKEGETNRVMTIVDLVVDGETGVCLLHHKVDISGKSGMTKKIFSASLNTLRCQPDSHWKRRHTNLNELEDRPTGFEE